MVPSVLGIESGSLDFFPPTQVLQVPLPAGDRGIAITIGFMRMAADQGQQDPQVRQFALQIVAGVANNDTAGEINAIFQWVKSNIRFRGELDETVQTPEVTLKFGAGDCDDFSVLLAGLLGSIGYQWDFKTMAASGNEFSHVVMMVLDHGSGQWTTLDATVAGSQPGWEPSGVSRTAVWSDTRMGYTDYRYYLRGGDPRLGDPTAADQISEVLTAATPFATGVIEAGHGQQVSLYPTYPPGPYASSFSLNTPLTQQSWFAPAMFGLAALAIFALSRKEGRR